MSSSNPAQRFALPPPPPKGAGPLSGPGVVVPPPRLRSLTDFPDRISPMIVKELRQGLRNRVFILAFVLLHAVLSLYLLFTLEAARPSPVTFWQMLGLVMGWLLPARNLSTLSDEIKLRTLDTLVLTRLTAWRIVLGKWACTAAQIGLIAVSVIPYLIMRYLSMGLNPVSEFAGLLRLTLVALTLTALLTGLSALGSWVVRTGVAIVGGFVLWSVMAQLVLPGAVSPGRFLATSLAMVFPAAWLSILMLDTGAAQIAPASENHSSLRRFVTFAMMLVAIAAARTGLTGAGQEFWTLPILITGVMLGLTDPPSHLPVIHAPFARRGWAGRFAALFLLPGPASGVLYAGLICGMWLWNAGAFNEASPLAGRAWSIAGGVLLSSVLLRICPQPWRASSALWISANLLLLLIGVLALTAVKNYGAAGLSTVIRFTHAGWTMDGARSGIWPSAILPLACWSVLLLLALPEFWRVRSMGRLVRENLHHV